MDGRLLRAVVEATKRIKFKRQLMVWTGYLMGLSVLTIVTLQWVLDLLGIGKPVLIWAQLDCDGKGNTSLYVPLREDHLTPDGSLRLDPRDQDRILSSLSSRVISEILGLQQVDNCNGTAALRCGHMDACGFACQIHHRMVCLAVSYRMGLPIIHDEKTAWLYKKEWREALEPLGSPCVSGGPGTVALTFTDIGGPRLLKECPVEGDCTRERVPFPFPNGTLTVPKDIGEIIQRVHSNPFLWWMGTFAKYAMRLTPAQEHLFHESRTEIGLQNPWTPTVGIHVRRTDKTVEAPNSVHAVEEYFHAIACYAARQPSSTKITRIRVFVASDAHEVPTEAKQKFRYPAWDVQSFPSTASISSDRWERLDDIIRDILILAETDFVACDFSSNICRLIAELMSSAHSEPLDRRMTSLDEKYYFRFYGGTFNQEVKFH